MQYILQSVSNCFPTCRQKKHTAAKAIRIYNSEPHHGNQESYANTYPQTVPLSDY